MREVKHYEVKSLPTQLHHYHPDEVHRPKCVGPKKLSIVLQVLLDF